MRVATWADIRPGAVIRSAQGYEYTISVVDTDMAIRRNGGMGYILTRESVDDGFCYLVSESPRGDGSTCDSCGVPFVDHDGVIRTCATLMKARDGLDAICRHMEAAMRGQHHLSAVWRMANAARGGAPDAQP